LSRLKGHRQASCVRRKPSGSPGKSNPPAVKWVRWASGEMSAHRATSTADPGQRPGERIGSPRGPTAVAFAPWVQHGAGRHQLRQTNPGPRVPAPMRRADLGDERLGAKRVNCAAGFLALPRASGCVCEPRCSRGGVSPATWISTPTQNDPTRHKLPGRAIHSEPSVAKRSARHGHAGANMRWMRGNSRRGHHRRGFGCRISCGSNKAWPSRHAPGFHHAAAISALATRRSTRCPFRLWMDNRIPEGWAAR